MKQSELNINVPQISKPAKQIAWKKDNGRHLFDHGLAVQFAEPAKAAFVKSLYGKDGKTVLSLGKSLLTIETIGRVSRIHFSDAIGNGFDHFAIHYFSPAEGLRFTLKRDETTKKKAFAVLSRAIFGDDISEGRYSTKTEVAPVLRCLSGAAQDGLRSFAATFAWALSGEAGLRAKALEKKDVELKDAVKQATYLVQNTEETLARAKSRDFRADNAALRKALAGHVDRFKSEKEKTEKALACVKTPLPEGFFTETSLYRYTPENDTEKAFTFFGARFQLDFSHANAEGRSLYRRSIYFPSVNAHYSHELIKPNYRVSRGENGTLRLSSGVVCPFTEAQALAWLKGQAPAPQTQYGACRKIEGRDESGKAVVLVACGCHQIDVATDLGGEYVDLLRPGFVVSQLSGTAAIYAEKDLPGFIARCEQIAEKKTKEENDRMALMVQEYKRRKTELEKTEANQPAFIVQLETELTARKTALTEAQTAQQRGTESFPGARLDVINAQNRAAFSAFASSKL